MIDHEKFLRMVHDWRGIEKTCEACGGSGVKVYGSTATWRFASSVLRKFALVCTECGTRLGAEVQHAAAAEAS